MRGGRERVITQGLELEFFLTSDRSLYQRAFASVMIGLRHTAVSGHGCFARCGEKEGPVEDVILEGEYCDILSRSMLCTLGREQFQ